MFKRIHISSRLKALIEVLAGFVFYFGYLWVIHPLYPSWPHVVVLILFVGLIFYSLYSRREGLKKLGLRRDNLKASARLVLPVTLGSGIIVCVVWSFIYPIDPWFFTDKMLGLKLLWYFFWALLQQFLLMAFFFRRLRDVCEPHLWPAVFSCALLFGLAHIPTPPLMMVCFAGGLFWCWAYHRQPNLFILAVSHAILAVLCSSFLLMYMKIGPDADVLRWTKQGSIDSSIDLVHTIKKPHRHDGPIPVKQNEEIIVTGWVADKKGPICCVYIKVDGRDYMATYGVERPDVSEYYKNPDYRYSGFKASIPASDLEPGYHALRLKVSPDRFVFYRYPGPRFWIKVQ